MKTKIKRTRLSKRRNLRKTHKRRHIQSKHIQSKRRQRTYRGGFDKKWYMTQEAYLNGATKEYLENREILDALVTYFNDPKLRDPAQAFGVLKSFVAQNNIKSEEELLMLLNVETDEIAYLSNALSKVNVAEWTKPVDEVEKELVKERKAEMERKEQLKRDERQLKLDMEFNKAKPYKDTSGTRTSSWSGQSRGL